MIGRTLLALAAAFVAAQPADAGWREASTDHFVIYSEQSADSLREFASRLERFDKAIRFIRNIDDAALGDANRLTIYVVKDLETVRKLSGAKGSAADGIAGFYVPRAEGSIAITPRRSGGDGKFDLQAETVLLHEYTHHFMLQTYTGAFPAWLVEGFAEFHSTARFEKDGSVGIGAPALHRAHSLLVGPRLPAERLMKSSVGELRPEERGALYARGWLLTHYLTFEPSRKGQLSTYIRKMNEGTKSLDAARAAFGDLKQLDRDLDRYVQRRSMNLWRLTPDKVTIGPIRIRDLSPAEDAVMDLKIRSRRGVDSAQAQALVPLVRRAAAPFPNDPFVQSTLSEAEFDAGNLAEAEAAADRALAANPKYVDALLYKARAQMAAVEKAGIQDKARWAAIRKTIIAANAADPDDPEPLILFYRSFVTQGVPPTKNAIEGLLTAAAAAPQDRGLRMNAGLQLLRDGKVAGARDALAPIAYDPHAGKMGEAAAQIIAKLDEAGAKAALDLSQALAPAAKQEGPD